MNCRKLARDPIVNFVWFYFKKRKENVIDINQKKNDWRFQRKWKIVEICDSNNKQIPINRYLIDAILMFNDMALVRGFGITLHSTFFWWQENFPDVQRAISIKEKKKKGIYIKEDSFIFGVKNSPLSKEKYIVNVDIVFISAMTRALCEVEWAL